MVATESTEGTEGNILGVVEGAKKNTEKKMRDSLTEKIIGAAIERYFCCSNTIIHT